MEGRIFEWQPEHEAAVTQAWAALQALVRDQRTDSAEHQAFSAALEYAFANGKDVTHLHSDWSDT